MATSDPNEKPDYSLIPAGIRDVVKGGWEYLRRIR